MADSVLGFDYEKRWDYENAYYLTSDPSRLSKALAHYELYKRILELPGHIVECGVLKGASLIRFATFREMYEIPTSRKIVGFDVFGKFPDSAMESDQAFIRQFEDAAGEGIPKETLEEVFEQKGLKNIELVQGDVAETIPAYLEQHPELKIALLHIDVDVYEPSVVILEQLYDRLVTGGLLVLDDYGTVHGETRAVDEFFGDRRPELKKLPIAHIPTYYVKQSDR